MRNSIIGAVLIGGAGLIINFVVLDIIRPGGGEAGTLGQGLSCDQLLRQTLQTNPVSLATDDNVHLVVKEIQAREECPKDSWNPTVNDTADATDSIDGVSLPGTLCDSNDCDGSNTWKDSPVRDARGNIAIRWSTTSGEQPSDRAEYWMYTASSGSWWSE